MTHKLSKSLAAGVGAAILALLAATAVAHGPGNQGGGAAGDRPNATQPAPGMGQGMMRGTTGQGMMGQQPMPCVDQGGQAAGPCAGQTPGQAPQQSPGRMPGRMPGEAPMLNQQIPPVRQ